MSELKAWKQNLKHLTHDQYKLLEEMCHLSKNVYNEALYNVRQQFFEDESFLTGFSNCKLLKSSENYKRLGGQMAQQTILCVDRNFKSFFALLRLKKNGKYDKRVHIPRYLNKDGCFKVCFPQPRIKDGYFYPTLSRAFRREGKQPLQIRIPKPVEGKKVHQVHILPKFRGRFFEAVYVFEDDTETQKPELDSKKFLGIDLGVNNLATCATNTGESFIIDGRRLKSANQWYNKEMSRLSSIRDRQGNAPEGLTKRQCRITRHRNNRVNNYIYVSAKKIVEYCVENRIGTIVMGHTKGFQENSNLGRQNNQSFVQIPFGKLRHRVEYLCNQAGIRYVEQDEGFTSLANFLQNDEFPLDSGTGATFTGKRVHRGLYRDNATGRVINADVNAALNILRKSDLIDMSIVQQRGRVLDPARVRIPS